MKQRTKPIKVLMFCPKFWPVVGGAERQAEKLSQALVAAGCRVTILTPRIDPDSPDIEVFQGVRIERFSLVDLARRWPIHGIALINIPAVFWQVSRAVERRLNGHDVLHCHIGSLQVAGAAWAGRRKRVPVLCKAAMADQRSDLGEIEKGGVSGYVVTWLLRLLIPTWIATTCAVKEALVRAGIGHARVWLIPNGVVVRKEIRNKTPGIHIKKYLYLGRLSTNIQRDVATLIRAFDRLAGMLADVELAVVGDGDLFQETADLAAKCTHSKRIMMPGYQKPEPWLDWADCFILPSRREGLSNALLEAMACGLPCIANDIPPNREVLDDGNAGVLVPVGDEEALYREMLRLSADPAFAADLGQRAMTRVKEHYSIESVAARYIDLYKNLIENTSEKKHDPFK